MTPETLERCIRLASSLTVLLEHESIGHDWAEELLRLLKAKDAPPNFAAPCEHEWVYEDRKTAGLAWRQCRRCGLQGAIAQGAWASKQEEGR